MVHHVRRLHNRQDTDLFNTPTGVGLTAATVAGTADVTAASLVFDSGAVAATNTAAAVLFSASATDTFQVVAQSSADSSASSAEPSSTAVSAGSTSSIGMGTVIGACLGALAGAAALILVALCLYKRGNRSRSRSPANAQPSRKGGSERPWGKLENDKEDTWEGKEGKYQQKGVVSVGPMEKLTMFKKSTPSIRTTYTHTQEPEPLPSVTHFTHPFAQYHPGLAKELAEDGTDLGDPLNEPPRRPFLARVDPVPPISWDGDTVGRDSFLSLSSNPAMSPDMNMAIPTPQLTSSEPHHWESAEVMHFDHSDDDRGRAPAVGEPRRKSANNIFFGARMSTYSSRSPSRSRTPSLSYASKSGLPDSVTMPVPTSPTFTYEEKGKNRAITPPSPTGSTAPSTITGQNPFIDPIVPFKPEHATQDSHDRALQSLIAALGPTHTTQDVNERLRVASMNPSVLSESAYTETDIGDHATLHQSWPVPPSRP
ncbi:hypothetical protein B0H10DRAFT_2216526 [Mycena sp. CBHHK59/15]|nr:hypothetical protein B0H10DRAFT_2216526 [Mycena sp. CBHHK59/15]